ncbi:PucR family transcriptional regulator [Nocardia lasii]|uniref:PucR family transcriptional regulator n=1 Tax=Nocardia lasii TaxID=1616107 RepID=A0ABW1JN58_9NOCA
MIAPPQTGSPDAPNVTAVHRILSQLLATLPCSPISARQLETVAAHCLGLLRADRPIGGGLDAVERIAGRWAAGGVSHDIAQHLVHAIFRAHVAEVEGGLGRAETQRLVEVVHAVTGAVSAGFAEFAAYHGEHAASVEVARALLVEHGSLTRVRHRHGVALSAEFLVLAVLDRCDGLGPITPVELHQRIGRRFAGQVVPAVIGRHGGTVLVPDTDILDEIATAVRDSTLSVVSLVAAGPAIALAAQQAHELLEVVQTVYGAPGLYPFAEFALEHQLTRPGPGRDRLADLIAPVARDDDLLTTLRTHLRASLRRRTTSRLLYVHPNTVDHRLRRIAELTGLDITDSATIWHLHAALIVHDFLHPDESVPGWRPARTTPRRRSAPVSTRWP